MCDLCSGDRDAAVKARKSHRDFADRLRLLAAKYDALGVGAIAPHTEDAKDVGVHARSIVRRLVEEWV